jgi:hypothetical protein
MVFQKIMVPWSHKYLKDFKKPVNHIIKKRVIFGNGLELAIRIKVLDYHSKQQKNIYLLEMEI